MEPNEIRIGPNPGPQSDAYASSADITVYGGQANGGKSFLTLLRNQHKDLLTEIRTKKELTGDIRDKLKAVAESYSKAFA